jgi:UDP-N-acetylmuramoylalanine--D-glutamate ligase
MITARAFAGKRYAVLGLARSGAATVEALLASGAEVVAWDSNPDTLESFRSSRAQSRGVSAEFAEGAGGSAQTPLDKLGTSGMVYADPLSLDLSGFAGVVVSPGVPINRHPIADHARKHNVPLIGDIELFAQARAELPAHKVVGITGTNGKSTTTALVHHILKTAGVPTTMGGNIGLPILGQDPLPEGGVYVLELSSYQIDLTYSLDCDVAVLLNITPDHLDRYESFEAYAASKERLLKVELPDQFILVHWDAYSNGPILKGRNVEVALVNLIVSADEEAQRNWPALQGPHNAENAGAAIQICEHLEVSPSALEQGLRTYSGLPHRMERVAERDGILFVNDSKATNTESTAPALAAYPHVHWIVGGQAKTDSLGPCEQQLGHVRAAYTIGEAGPLFARLLHGKVQVVECQVLERAVTEAAAAARAGEVVLLSPACASFDQFRDYEARGAAFRAAVEALP